MSIKKALLVFPIYTDINKEDGIVRKNNGIHKAFLHHGIAADALKFRTTGIYQGEEQVIPFSKNRYVRGWQLYAGAWKKIARYAVANSYELVWVRLPLINPFLASFIEHIKKNLPQCRIIIEYGAYPFESELTPAMQRLYRINKRYERKAHHFADYIITYTGPDSIDGVPVIPIDNGIDLDHVPLSQPDTDTQKEIRFVSVSSLKKWHAVERFIAGMPAYLAQKNAVPIHFDVIGMGSEYEKVKGLSDSLGLQQVVTFHGFQSGAGIDAIYRTSHVAIGTLGFHRIGISNSSSLKNREYFARGLPVVLSTPDKDMPADLPYVKYVPEGEEAVDIGAVVDFAKRIYSNGELAPEIRAYAEKQVSWNSKIDAVLRFVEKN
jgi:glycosyltransferase involved in cell wall biosynthesis